MEVNETSAARVNDVYSELAKITAADTEQIGIAMSKVASLAHSANMEFETTAAFLTQIIETTQEAPSIDSKKLKLRAYDKWLSYESHWIDGKKLRAFDTKPFVGIRRRRE